MTPYARFYKCDLQMQTPLSPHWREGNTRLTGNDSDVRKREVARAYLKRCHEVGIEIIGITDHNFSRNPAQSFIQFLKSENESVASELGRKPLVIFPGFEIEADVGKGCHVVCLFPPEADLGILESRVTECGLRADERFDDKGKPRPSTKRLPEILDTVQKPKNNRGIVICPHPFDRKGILNDGEINIWLQQEEFLNSDLLAIEIPRPLDSLPTGLQKLLRAGDDCDPAWRRKWAIACVMSSDTYRLAPVEGDNANYPGFRYTWIKMSQPSIEGLRQSFLDQQSRIRFGERRPEEGYTYPKIRSVKISGAKFLKDQEINFSPNMNNLIGGRGTGKSTVIEYLRVVLGQNAAIRGKDARDNFEKIRQTIGPQTSIEVEIEQDGAAYRLQSLGGQTAAVVHGAPIPNLPKFFQARILSQREIYAIAEDREARARLLDDLIRNALDPIGRRAEDLAREIRHLNEQILDEPKLRQRLKDLATERLDLSSKLDSLKRLEEPLKKWKGLLAEQEFFDGLDSEGKRLVERLRADFEALELSSTVLGADLDASPNAALVRRVAERAEDLLEKLKASVTAALGAFESGLRELLSMKEVAVWRRDFEEATAGYEKLKAELQDKGADPDQYLTYQRGLRSREAEIKVLEEKIKAIETVRKEKEVQLKELHQLWMEESTLRKTKSQQLQESVPTTPAGRPFVEVAVTSYGDDAAFYQIMGRYLKDKRRISDDEWNELIAAACKATPQEESPTGILLTWVASLRKNQKPNGFPWSLSDRRTEVLLGWIDEAAVAEIELLRVPDRLIVSLYRQDGTLAGELEEGLSVGQKCTAILALLLAQDNAPAVIDQPEEELDNEFIYRELVPLLRRVKEERQLIIATHNANLPVNGDAELIYALEARGGRGVVKEIEGKTAVGALDMLPVRKAVEEIMEGSEEAFRRRHEKYGF